MRNLANYLILLALIFASCEQDQYHEETIISIGPEPFLEFAIEDSSPVTSRQIDGIKYVDGQINVKALVDDFEIIIDLPCAQIGKNENVNITLLGNDIKRNDVNEINTLQILEFNEEYIRAEFNGSLINNNGQTNKTVNIQFVAPIKLGGTFSGSVSLKTWFDSNGNHLLDPTESGVNGLKIELLKVSCAAEENYEIVDSLFTSAIPFGGPEDGLGHFNNIELGHTYQLISTDILDCPHHQLVTANQGEDDNIDSDFDVEGKSPFFQLSEFQQEVSFSLGLK